MKRKYRWHQNFRLFQALSCHQCSHESWHHIFKRCGYHCSYLELLSYTANRSLADAVELEYIRAHDALQRMVSNIVRLSNNSEVLQLIPEHFWPERIGETLGCIFRFLLGSGNEDFGDSLRGADGAPLWQRRWVVDDEQVEHLARSMEAILWDKQVLLGGINDIHSTSLEKRWAGLDLRVALLRHPTWGPPLRKAQELLRSILWRQKIMYGCPAMGH